MSRDEIEAFMRSVVREIEALEAGGVTEPGALAEALNARGVTTRRGRRWNRATVAKFLSSPGAHRLRTVPAPGDSAA